MEVALAEKFVKKAKNYTKYNINIMDENGIIIASSNTERIGSFHEVAYQLLKYLLENYREKLEKRYGLDSENINQILMQEQPENFNIYEVMQLIGKKRGAIVSGGNVDDEKVANIILDDFRSGRIGKITLEKVK